VFLSNLNLQVLAVPAVRYSRTTMAKKTPWYDKCGKAPWQPPSIAFRIVWPILYALYALALYMEWSSEQTINYLLLGLVLNLCWVPAFTYNVRLALLLLTCMIAVAVKCIMIMKHKWILAPYLAWICFAWTLNAYLAWSCV